MSFAALTRRISTARPAAVCAAILLVSLFGCTSDWKMIINKSGPGMWGLTVNSTSFNNGQPMPSQYTADGQDISPQLSWTQGPEGVKSFAIAMEDPDAGTHPVPHWLLWNIPADTLAIPEGGGGAYPQGQNYKGTIGYTGPTEAGHLYFFQIFALNTTLSLQPGATRDDFITAIDGHIISVGEWVGAKN